MFHKVKKHNRENMKAGEVADVIFVNAIFDPFWKELTFKKFTGPSSLQKLVEFFWEMQILQV